MDLSLVVESLRTALGPDVTEEEVQTALSEVDTTALENEVRGRYRTEVWDRVSPINGVPAEKILERPDISDDGEVVLIYRGERVLMIQPFDPESGGKISSGLGASVGDRQIMQIAESEAAQEAAQSVQSKVSNARSVRKNVDQQKINELQSAVDQLVLDSLMGGPTA